MLLKQLILLVLLAQTPHYRDTESWEGREARLEIIAEGIHNASLRATCQGPYAPPADRQADCARLWPSAMKDLAFMLATQSIHETHLSAEIHHNHCRLEIGECDSRFFYSPGSQKRVYVQRSFSPWQIKLFEDIPHEDWAEIQKGVPGTEYAAWHAARRLSSGYRACGSLEGAVSRYALGNGCKWKGSAERIETFRSLMSKSADELLRARDRQELRALGKTVEQVATR